MTEQNVPIVVVFGRPGAGKTTIAEAADKLLKDKHNVEEIITLDLDVCIPQWMKDNFTNGIYPTLAQRDQFAGEACDYVHDQIKTRTPKGAIISFSFVNNDLRNVFRSRFTGAHWMLVDTSAKEAEERIKRRNPEHFYKGAAASIDEPKSANDGTPSVKDQDNCEWKFDDVDFKHTILNGLSSIESNAALVTDAILSMLGR
uniref:Uncharacterized protein n=1 Tax=Leptocylindrus danicus TaxID=163516 RepID=A0A7S2K7C5_9STRA|mmetsp:Transcript_18267/g.27131  ORF Transcript_18267/g.27131 Transcript_18267/m.27131 type:complete len:201 (+) Transcript_18267:247-849(+)